MGVGLEFPDLSHTSESSGGKNVLMHRWHNSLTGTRQQMELSLANYRDRLLEKMQQGQVVALIGTGVSTAVTKGATTANWVGLIQDGIDRAATLARNPSWRDLRELSLEQAVEYSDVSELISVATAVADVLRPHRQAYTDWLREAIGELPIAEAGLVRALGSLNIPLLTTNYDTLVSRILGRASVTWQSGERMRQVFTGRSPETVGHLHGSWEEPDSIILSSQDYARITLQHNAKFLQQSQYASKSFLFVGCGDGLDDPNFSTMLSLHREMFPDSLGDHFRLCRDEEVDGLSLRHTDDDIRILGYGPNHDDLVPYLEQLAADSGNSGHRSSRLDTVAFAREHLLEKIQKGSAQIRSGDGIPQTLEQCVVPPLLLPMSHEQFASTKSRKGGADEPETLDPYEVAYDGSCDVQLVVGSEHSGVTTALQWLLATNAMKSDTATPIYVDGHSCPRDAKEPLKRRLSHEARDLRIIDRLEEELPPLSVALDNLVYREDAFYEKVMDDVLSVNASYMVIGCKPEDEPYIVKSLEYRDISVRTIHMGKLTKNEVAKYTSIISPTAHVDSISEAVLEIARRERLPRNPFTISLLIALILELGQRDERYDSETTVLDEYTKLLLGMFGERVDSRINLTYKNKEKILSRIAKEYVLRRVGSLRHSKVLECIEETFDAFSWKEDPDKSLKGFYKSRILRKENDQIKFQQSSYLYLFAAKAALADEEFLGVLFDDPLYFAPIIQHYAALRGDSAATVTAMVALLDPWQDYEPTGRIFGDIEVSPYKESENEKAEFDLDEGRPAQEEEQGKATHTSEVEAVPYDTSDDSDTAPFPTDDLGNLSDASLLSRQLTLASKVLRDSDELANPDLKAEALMKVLQSWAILIELFELEGQFGSVVSLIVENDEHLRSMSEEKKADITGRANLLLPSIFAMGGMNASLASRKLLITLDRVMQSEGFYTSPFAPVGAAIYALLVHEENWSAGLARLLDEYGDKWVVSGFISLMTQMAHKTEMMTQVEERQVRDFIVGAETRKKSFKDDAQRKNYISRLKQRLERTRTLNSRRRLTRGSASTQMMEGAE